MAIIKASLVDVHLGMASNDIAGSRQKLKEAKAAINGVISMLNSIPTKYGDMIETVSASGYNVDAYTNANRARLTALSEEFTALNAQAKIVSTWLSANTTEF